MAIWDGPLSHLLDEARARRVDLTKISMADLVARCLDALSFIASTTDKAEMLTLAATLTEMKARLLLRQGGEEDEEAERLRARLLGLQAMQEAATALMSRDLLERDVFARGAPETGEDVREIELSEAVDLLDLVRAYARLRVEEDDTASLEVRRVIAMSLKDGLEALGHVLPEEGWADLFALISAAPRRRAAGPRSAAAAALVAALEMARAGEVVIRQNQMFGKIEVSRV